ncbi:hypothetical protein MKW94_003650 [Papaver nudicaule]|uniref:Uncharacterized protein n=1 Tax=Papaver nudicaule TaxID=74823 RepID=A0AA41S843_PAPNU|nr:hypothetical protein [Papaver nudicaule]
MSVLVIKPKAFRKGCVGEVLSAIVVNSFGGLIGMKLVRKADCPDSAVWSDSCTSTETEEDECAIAVVVGFLLRKFELCIEEPDVKNIDFDSRVFRVGSDYVYRSKPGENLWQEIGIFFSYGFTLWTAPYCDDICGKMFEPSLVGLL